MKKITLAIAAVLFSSPAKSVLFLVHRGFRTNGLESAEFGHAQSQDSFEEQGIS